jgi:tetratricopeptide (TPR) repeat protein
MSFGLFVALLARRINGFSRAAGKVAYGIAGMGIVILAVMTVMHNRTWKNERTLWAANYKAVPNSPRAAMNLGNTYQETDLDKAAEYYKRALGLNPTPEIKRSLHDRLAVILIHQQRFDEAEFFVGEVLSRSPTDFFGNLWASQIHTATKKCVRAGEELALAESVAATPREQTLAQERRQEWERLCKPAPQKDQDTNGSSPVK